MAKEDSLRKFSVGYVLKHSPYSVIHGLKSKNHLELKYKKELLDSFHLCSDIYGTEQL